MSAWRSFFAAAGRDQIAVPDDDNLWPLLVTMTLRKLARQAERHTAAKRSVESEVRVESWPQVVSRDPSPEEAAMVADEIESLMSALSESDRVIVTRRLQGDEHASIAAAVGCAERTVRRALQRARDQFLSRQPAETDFSIASDMPTADRDSSEDGHEKVTSRLASSTERRQLPLAQASFAYGDVVLEQLIGQGAFGRVYRARLTDGRPVAVKFLRKNLWQNSQAAEQLIREVSIVSGLSHPGIVRHHGWGQTDAGAVFAVMEFVDGQDLWSWRQNTTVTLRDLIQCGLGLCEAAAAAHHGGVIHGDLTPGNVLRRSDGQFVLTDFGFSQVAGDPLRIAAGTPGFLAPEQLSDAFGIVSNRTDVYGIGGVLYFLLTAKPPVSGETASDVIAEGLSSSPVAAVEVTDETPAELSELVQRCLRKESQDRPESVEAVRLELRKIEERG